MIFCRHHPAPPLGACVDHLWFFEGLEAAHRMENVVPDGSFELIIDLRDAPRKLFDRNDTGRYQSFRRAWISGTHSEYIVIDVLPKSSMIGAHFRPGGAAPFLGFAADEMADRVVELDFLWGDEAARLREQLLAASTPPAKFQCLENFLQCRLKLVRPPRVNRVWVDHAIARIAATDPPGSIAAVAAEIGVSHKHLIAEFRRVVGLTPKAFCRIRRFQEVLRRINARERVDWADVACACGYYDQAHFVRDFKSFAGLTPTGFLGHDLEDPKFIPVRR